MNYYTINASSSLKHHQIKGAHWGVRRAEWYPIDKYKEHLQSMGYSERTIKRKMKKAIKGEIKYKKQLAKNRQENLAKAQQARKDNLAWKKEKEEIIKTGDINKAAARLEDFSNEELKAIKDRNQAKMDIIKAKTDKTIRTLGTIADVSNKIMNISGNVSNTYENINKIRKLLGDDDEPKIVKTNKTINEDKGTITYQQTDNKNNTVTRIKTIKK